MEIFQFEFMQRAFVSGMVIAVIAPGIGMFLVVRRYSLMADTLAHVSLAGVAIGMLTNANPLVAAVISTVIAALGIERLRSTKTIFGESVLALFLSGSLAISAVLLSLARGLNANLLSVLFGSIVTVSHQDVILTVALGIVVILTIFIFYHQLFTVSFDEEVARVNGMNVAFYNSLIVVLAAITVSLAIRVVGVLLIGALMVIPSIAALQWQLSFRKSLLLAMLFSVISVFVGLISSYYFDLASGGTIVLVTIALFLFSLFLNRR